MSWRTNPAAIPNNARDWAEKIDALGLKGLSPKERRLAKKDARAISAFLPEAKGKALVGDRRDSFHGVGRVTREEGRQICSH